MAYHLQYRFQTTRQMKKIFLLAGLALSLGAAVKSDAQVRINVNIGAPMPVAQQSWYGSDADYYYMPDQGVYYNVNRRMYVWPNGGSWMCGPSLPRSYGACTWGNSRYYSFRGRSPFMRHDYYRNQYGGRGGGGYAYRNDRGYDGRRDGRFENRGGGRWDNNRGGGRGGDNRGWDNDRGGRGGNNDRDGRGGDRNYGNNGGGNNGSGSQGRGGWDRR